MKYSEIYVIIAGLLISSALGFSQIASAEQMELQPSFDNTIYSEHTTVPTFPMAGEEKSCGECPGIAVGKPNTIDGIRRGLIYFDIVGNFPSGITVTNVELDITIKRSMDPIVRTMFVHPITKTWGEAGSTTIGFGDQIGLGGFALTGDATWTDAIYDDTSNWTTPGGDFNSPVASVSVGTIGTSTFSSVELTSLVQQWVDESLVNNGLLLKFDDAVESTNQTSRYIYSSEGFSPPILRVTYTLPEPDDDGDGIPNSSDNCPATPNLGQGDLDNDSIGDACDGLNLITSNTSVTADVISLGDVLIYNNSLLTIESGFTLSINSSLIVQNGSGALIKSGATISILA